MDSPLSAAKILLLAVNFAAHSNIDNLGLLAHQYSHVLTQRLLLRILLSYLPETINPTEYIPLLQYISIDKRIDFVSLEQGGIDYTSIEQLTDEGAEKKVRKLHLRQLHNIDGSTPKDDDDIISFLKQRVYRIDSQTGLLSFIPTLLAPFVNRSDSFCLWVISTVEPFVKRYSTFYTNDPDRILLEDFEKLSDGAALTTLLGKTAQTEHPNDGCRDVYNLVLPWISNKERWTGLGGSSTSNEAVNCVAWRHFLELMLTWNLRSWSTTVNLVEHWNGSRSVELSNISSSSLDEAQYNFLDNAWDQAIITCVYNMSNTGPEAIHQAYSICTKMLQSRGISPPSELELYLSSSEKLAPADIGVLTDTKLSSFLRNHSLDAKNILTTPTSQSLSLLSNLIGSTYICNRFGLGLTVRHVADLVLSQDLREQKALLSKLIRGLCSQPLHDDDSGWLQARTSFLWLRHWNINKRNDVKGQGLLGAVGALEIESEILKSLLEKSKYSIARSIYETSSTSPLPQDTVRGILHSTALNAFDNASNPNRTRGGLKKCDEIIHSLPKTLPNGMQLSKEIEALLRATHALSDYRLVLKQGEPFSPVVLRVHSDPVSIISRALEQNPKAYTRLQEFIEIGANLVQAGLVGDRRNPETFDEQVVLTSSTLVEKRIVSMCIEAALREDDFETAYSYVVSKLSSPSDNDKLAQNEWVWTAAFKAGQYVRTEKSQRPTHLGTASGNPTIRHFQQRIECLATALRVAPPAELQNILKLFRRCEEQLDSAIKEEAANEAAWDTTAELNPIPGTFDAPKDINKISRNLTAAATARQGDDAPVSLFDLSRATARIAQRNFSALSRSNESTQLADVDQSEDIYKQRVRRRDQLREAATGTLVSGVGWLIGANPARDETQD